MKDRRILRAIVTLFTCMFTTTALAYDIVVRNTDGVRIYYNYINNGQELEVTYGNNYSGSVIIPDSVTIYENNYPVTCIGNGVFANCTNLTSITIGNCVTSIGYEAFAHCTNLTSVTIGTNVMSIGRAAFSDCSNLGSVTIPNSVTSIGIQAFYGCLNLTSITIGNSVTSIGDNAFSYCNHLTSIIIPNSVTSIGHAAFRECDGLTTITIGNNVTSIGNRAFLYCCNLASVTIPNSVTSLGSGAFEGCWSLTTVTIGNSVTSIGDNTFAGCSDLTTITIGNSVTSIGREAFLSCSVLTSVTIPNSVTSIRDSAFKGCSSLTIITIPNSVTSIRENTFEGCTSLTSITIPNNVTTIGECAFKDCTSLTTITIPNSVTSIGHSAFYNTPWLNNKPDGLVYAGLLTYSYKGKVPEGKIIVIEEGTRGIANNAFANCIDLTSISIPNSVTSIGERAFQNCSELTDVYSYVDVAPDAAANAFEGSFINQATLHVPETSVNKYKRTNVWTNFGTIVSVPAITYMVDGQVYKTDTPMVGETIIAEPEPTKEGYTFSGWSEIPETMPAHDVTITGTFALDSHAEPCAKPTIRYKNGVLSFECKTEGAEFVYEIYDDDIKTGNGSTVDLSVTYTITVFATRESYKDSEIATATLCWIDAEPQTEGITEDTPTDVVNVKAMPVLIQRDGNAMTISGASAGTPISVYDLSGKMLGQATAVDGVTQVVCENSEKVVIVRVGERSVKVAR